MEALASKQWATHFNKEKWLLMKEHSKSTFFRPRIHTQVATKSEESVSRHNNRFLNEMPATSTFGWNKSIQTHLTNGKLDKVMHVYQQMLVEGVCPDKHTLPRILDASRLWKSVSLGMQIHGHAVKLGNSSEDYVVTALMRMYGDLVGSDAVRKVFDTCSVGKNSVARTLLISTYMKESKYRLAIDLFAEMVSSGCKFDAVAMITAIGACGMISSLSDGKKMHMIARANGLESHLLVGNSLLKMYVDCRSIEDARAVFDGMSSRDLISWTEMIHGYVQNGEFNEGLKLFKTMVSEGIQLDLSAIASVLPACARMTAHKQGKEIHCYLIRNKFRMNVTVQNALLDMYVKSGYIEMASRIFDRMANKDEISWTIMIHGYSLHGQGEKGIELFHEMQKSRLKIDRLTYASALHACVAANLVEEGKTFFNLIKEPEIRHYAMMVLLLARAGLSNEAKIFIEENRLERHVEVLRALLDGYRACLNVKEGIKIVKYLYDMEPYDPDNYIMFSNWYASKEKWDVVDYFRGKIRDRGLVPKMAYSWIEYRNKIHVFGTGDVSHPQSKILYLELQRLARKLEEEGYKFDLDFRLHDVDEERECKPTGHCELKAIAFGLIFTRGFSIRVTKNLRICRNCHNMAKVVSKRVAREIIVKDPYCFHHFKDGRCSCGDLW